MSNQALRATMLPTTHPRQHNSPKHAGIQYIHVTSRMIMTPCTILAYIPPIRGSQNGVYMGFAFGGKNSRKF